MDQIKIRTLQETDLGYVFSTWLKCYKNYSYFAKKIRNKIFFTWHHKILESLVQRPKTLTLIAHPEGDPFTIIGYLCFERDPDLIHFIFVKKEFQRMGVAKALIKQAEVNLDDAFFTHWTFALDELIKKYPGLTYDPYRI